MPEVVSKEHCFLMTAVSEAVAAGEQSTASHPRITDITTSVLGLANEYQKVEVYIYKVCKWVKYTVCKVSKYIYRGRSYIRIVDIDCQSRPVLGHTFQAALQEHVSGSVW